ncbi:MAG: putative RNA-binding protein (virulence factor B family), partial [Planctomycetota bacterium]
GFLPLHDKSSPADIAQHFDLSKRVFKAAIGGLFKRERIELLSDGIRLRSDT